MAKLDFTVHYTGSALDEGRMPIRELAPALLALSETFQAIQEMENPEEPAISADIQATSKGSFIVNIILANGQDIFQGAVDLLSGKGSSALVNLITYIEIFKGTIGLVVALHNHKIKKVDDSSDGNVTIKVDDDTTITIPASQLRAYRNIEIRKSIENVVKPLKQPGIDGVSFSSTKVKEVSISSDKVQMFDAPEAKDESLTPTVAELYLQLVSVAFEHGKWKFSDGNNQFYAKIEDEPFLKNVEKNEVQFGSTDSLKVRLRTEQKITDSGLRAEYFIEKVLEHRKGARQLELDFENDDKE
jgi:hypothetical protein